jgi:poly(A) polymerase
LFYDPIAEKIIDYVGGQEDINKRLVRSIGDPVRRFEEDHLRLLRAVRFAARFDYTIEDQTFAAAKKLAFRIRRTSAERVRDELTMMLTGPNPVQAFELLRKTGLLQEVLPEVGKMTGVEQPPQFSSEIDVWTHVMKVLAQLHDPSPVLAWAALLHDVGKPATYAAENQFCFNGHAVAGARISREICERLKMPRVMVDRLCYIVMDHMKFINIKNMRESTLKRFLREKYFLELLELHRAGCLASQKNLATHDFCIKMLAGMAKKDLHPARILDGSDLVAMGFKQGPPLGEILFALESEQLEGQVRTRGEAKAFVNKRFGALRIG